MTAFDHFLAMGGYARYVWPAYGVAIVVLGGLVLTSLRRFRSSRRALEALEAQAGTRRRDAGPPSPPQGRPQGHPGGGPEGHPEGHPQGHSRGSRR